jgi:hypothetical protein
MIFLIVRRQTSGHGLSTGQDGASKRVGRRNDGDGQGRVLRMLLDVKSLMEGVRRDDMGFLKVVDEGMHICEGLATTSIISALPKKKRGKIRTEIFLVK